MALIPPFYSDCVVAIGIDDQNMGERQWVASGFLYGKYIRDVENGKKLYSIYLVTNRHVFENLQVAYLRFNPKASEPAREFELILVQGDGTSAWIAHPNAAIDVAVVPISFKQLDEHGMQANYFRSSQHVANIDKLNELEVTEGDFVYVLGFPMGLVGGERNVVVVRSGSIARIRDVLVKANQEFLIDAFIFPGNSGGPVVLKPEVTAIQGTKSQTSALLIGIVKAYVTYRDVAVSLQSKKPRIIFEENSGLAAVHPIDYIQEAIDEHEKLLGEAKEERQID